MTSDAPEEPQVTTGASEDANGERERPVSEDGKEPQATTPSSGKSSGEGSEGRAKRGPRDCEREAGTTRERSDPRDGESRRDSETRTESEARAERDSEESKPTNAADGTDVGTDTETETDGADDDIPLSIAGHEDRDPLDGASSMLDFGDESAVSDDPFPDAVPEAADDDDEDVQPVELLVQLAKDGEIDPWDIDIVHVTDTFLDALDEADLRTSGRALFYASVLLRMKSDVLFSPDEPDEEELPPWEAAFVDDEEPVDDGGEAPGFDPVERLEAEMDRRLERQHARGKPETLDELVRELRDAERGSWWKRSREYDTSNSPSGFNRGVQELSYHSEDAYRGVDEPTADDVTHTQHDEEIDAVIADVEAALAPHYEGGREEVLFAEIEDAGGSRVMTYLALLFLAHRGQLRLEQDELFGDLWIQQVAVEVEASEAVAD